MLALCASFNSHFTYLIQHIGFVRNLSTMHFKKQFIEAIVRHHVTLKKRRAEITAQFKEAVV